MARPQVHLGHGNAVGQQVHVRVVEAGDDETTAEIDFFRPRTRKATDFFSGADGENAAAPQRDRL